MKHKYYLRKRKTPEPPPSESSSSDESEPDSDPESEGEVAFLRMLDEVCPKSVASHTSTESASSDTTECDVDRSSSEEVDEEEEEEEEDSSIPIGSGPNIFIVSPPGKDVAEDDIEEDNDNDADFGSEDEDVFVGKASSIRRVSSEVSEPVDIAEEYATLSKERTVLEASADPRAPSMLRKCNTKIRELVKTARHENTKKYHKLVHASSKSMNEMEYFKTRMSNQEQMKVMDDLREINGHLCVEKPYRLLLLQTNIPPVFKAIAMAKLNMLKSMGEDNSEYYKLKRWVDTFMRIPFGIYRTLNIHLSDGKEVCNAFMENAKKTLDNCVYGLNDAKLQVMQMLGQWLVNPKSVGTAIAIHGPPGTGKTSIVKDGISKILGRDFAFIALGGSTDSSVLEGHSYTYEGSTWGKIVQILIDSKSMNPVIYFDELDKVSDTARGQEIIGILTHLTDTTQNGQFHDKYFSEVDFDLSKALFIFSYNDESMVNPILKDRMYRIRTNGYDSKDKLVIARKYLLPKICEQVNMAQDDVVIPDETLLYIINSPTLSKGEQGVRNLKRCLEIIYTKLNLFRVMNVDNDILKPYADMKVSFPYTVSRKDIDVLVKKEDPVNLTLLTMYI